MEYLNNFSSTGIILDEQTNLKEFSRHMELDTIVENYSKTGTNNFEIKFDADKIVFDGDEVLVEFMDWEDKAVIGHFESNNIPGLTKGGFTAVEMFYNLMTFQKSIYENCGFFKSIKFVDNIRENGKVIPLYKVQF